MHILLVGDYGHREFQDAVAWMAENADLEKGSTFELELARLESGLSRPQVLVVAQSRPGQFSPLLIQRAHAIAPLTRLVALLGSWCEGEVRTGHPWPGVVRVYWHQWLPRCAREVRCLLLGEPGMWSQARTASDAEMLLQGRSKPRRRRGLIAIRTASLTTYDALADACRTLGYATAWLAPAQPPFIQGSVAVLWDAVRCDSRQWATLEQAARSEPGTPLLALLGHPRWEDRQQALAAGAAEVLAKPFLLEDLAWTIERIVREESESAAA